MGQETKAEGRYQFAVWDTATGRKCFDLGPETNLELQKAAWSPDNKRVALATSGPQGVQIYDTGKGEAVGSINVKGFAWWAWEPGARQLITISRSSREKSVVCVWDAENGKEVRSWPIEISPMPFGIGPASLSPDGRSVALVPEYGDIFNAVATSRDIRICDMATGATRQILRGHTGPVHNVAWSPDGRRLASSGNENKLKIWDVESGEPVYSFPFSRILNGQPLSWSPDGRTLTTIASQEQGRTVVLWDTAKRGRWYPSEATARSNLAVSLATRPEPWLHDPERAIQLAKQATELAPQNVNCWVSLGFALRANGDQDGAVAAYRKAIEVESDYPEAHLELGRVLCEMGKFVESLTSLRRGRELGSNKGNWSNAALAAEWIKQCERHVELDGKLPDILSGKQQPANAAERVEYAKVGYYKQLNAAATRLYREALDAQRDLPATQLNALRYDAACTAARAGADDKLTEAERAAHRKQALEWLRANLDSWRGLMDKEPGKNHEEVVRQMRHWQRDRDLNGVRGVDALAKLPEVERKEWQKLWADVATLARAQKESTPAGKETPPQQGPKNP